MSLLILENICKEYRNQSVLGDVSLRVEKKERLALIGPNGAGKTTLLKIAMGLENPDSGSVTTAHNIKIGYLSQDLQDVISPDNTGNTALHYEKVYRLERKLRELEKQMAEHTESPGHKDLLDEYSRCLSRFEAMDGYVIEAKIKKILVGLGLRHETLSTPLDRLSGGEKMRVAVARMILEEPDLLILDEPTNHLDIQATEWFEGFLKKFEGGILFVSHDRYFLDKVATRVAELDQGGLCVRSGNYSNYLKHKNQLSEFVHNEQKRLRWMLRNANEKAQGLKSRGNIKAAKSRAKEIDRLNDELKNTLAASKQQNHLGRADSPKISFKKVKHVSKDIAWAENLQKSFGDVVLFAKASFHIRGGERVGIIGPNGCGKTTLINMLLGNDQKYQGFLRLGEWVKYSYMGQEVLFDNEELTILQFIQLKREMTEGEAREYLARFQFYGDDVDKILRVLSGGERVRLYLACVMLENADCLILDEPTNHLDVPARDAVEAALKQFKGTIIAVTHDRFYLTHCVDKILEIDQGQIITYQGNYDFYRLTKFGPDEEPKEEGDSRTSAGPAKNSRQPKSKGLKPPSPEKQRQEIETQIIDLEDKIKEIEAGFDKSTPPEKYQDYDELLREVNRLYSQWNDLIS